MDGVGSISDAQAFTYLVKFVASLKVTFKHPTFGGVFFLSATNLVSRITEGEL